MTATPIHDAAFVAVVIRDAFADLWQQVGGSPLALGHFCPDCGTRLDKADRPCPFAPHDAPTKRTYRRKRATSPTRLAILHESALLYAVSAA